MTGYRALAICWGLSAFIACGAAGNAQAQLRVFNSFGARFTSLGYADCVSGPDNPGCGSSPASEWIGAAFTPSASGALDFIDVAAAYDNGTQGIIVTLVEDNAGWPSALTPVLETFYVAQLPTGTNPKVKLNSKLHPLLTAGVQYWLLMQPAGYDGLNVWYLSPRNQTSPRISSDGGNTWYIYGTASPYTNLPAFAVYEQ